MAAFEAEVELGMRRFELKLSPQVAPDLIHNQLESAEVAG